MFEGTVDVNTLFMAGILNGISIALVIIAVLAWRGRDLSEGRNIFYLVLIGIFTVVDLVMVISMVQMLPVFTPIIAVFAAGSYWGSEEWENASGPLKYNKIYIIMLSLSLIPSYFVMIYPLLGDFGSLGQPGNPIPSALIAMFMFWIIPLSLLPKWGRGSTGHRIGVGWLLAGVGLGTFGGYGINFLDIGRQFGAFPNIPYNDVFIYLFSVIALIGAFLLFISVVKAKTSS